MSLKSNLRKMEKVGKRLSKASSKDELDIKIEKIFKKKRTK